MYVPSFFESFLALVLVILWTRWMTGRPRAPGFARFVPWVVGGVLLASQAAGTLIVLQAAAGSPTPDAEAWVMNARLVSAGTIALGALVLAGATAASLRKG